MSLRFGFRIVGPLHSRRRLVDHNTALAGYAACDERADVGREGHLSIYCFDSDFQEFLDEKGSTRGFEGVCWAPWLYLDLDREGDLQSAADDASRLTDFVCKRYQMDPGGLLIFFSGSKGFHIGLPTSLWNPAPSLKFHRIARRLAEHLSAQAGVAIDSSVYGKGGVLRAPNSRHPRTRLYKRTIAFEQLKKSSVEEILSMAKTPEPFELPPPTPVNLQAATDWYQATQDVTKEIESQTSLLEKVREAPTLNQLSLDFIRNGDPGDSQANRLFSAAANLKEFDCSPALAHALLLESARDSGLRQSEAIRHINNGLKYRPKNE